MFPNEIINTDFWIRHALPTSSPLSPRLTDNLRADLRGRQPQLDDALFETLIRRERARLDLKWCLDEFFYTTVSHPTLDQLVTANISGSMRFAYIPDVSGMNTTVSPVEHFGYYAFLRSDDNYTAHYTPSYNNFVAQHTIFHRQHVRDYVTNQCERRSSESTETNSSDLCVQPFASDAVDDTWHFHDPNRNVKCTQGRSLLRLTLHIRSVSSP